MNVFYNSSIINNATINKINDIEDSNKDLTVLIGKGTGRSTLLENLSLNDNLKYNYINMYIDALQMFNKDDKDYNNEVVNTYYELRFARNLLKQFDEKFIHIDTYTKRLNTSINNELKDFDTAYNKYYLYDDYTTINNLKYTRLILNNYKELNNKKIALMINRFDHINGNDQYTQKYLSEYFNYFDKVIITSDDETLHENNNNYKIKYDIKEVEQIVRYNILNFINSNKVIEANKEKYIILLNEYINPINVGLLYTEFNGNLKDIIDVYKYFVIYGYKLETDIDKVVDNVNINNEIIDRCSKKLKLYI